MRHVVAREHRDVGAPLALAKVLEPREEALAAHEQLQGVNSIGQKKLGQVLGKVFGPNFGQILGQFFQLDISGKFLGKKNVILLN